MKKKLSDLEFSNRIFKNLPFLFENVSPEALDNPQLLHINSILLEKLDLSFAEIKKKSTLDFLNGDLEFDGVIHQSSYYSGHQFGHFVPRLGDGRAIFLGEIKTNSNEYYELQIKGSGLTPFSRMGDGRAVLRSSIREYLASAHLKSLNVPTTEALSLISGSDFVRRENIESAASVVRVSESFLRFGHFEFLFHHRELEELRKLVEVTIEFYFPQFLDHPNRYRLFFQETIKRTAKLMALWQSVGFCHGVMNTDNMSILGLTLDYGPFGFIEHFDLDHICNHSDVEGRYSFGNQPPIAKWNLEKLAMALSPLIADDDSRLILASFEPTFHFEYQRLLRQKLGLIKNDKNDEFFLRKMLKMLFDTKLDYTHFFRQLSQYKKGERTDNAIPLQLRDFLDEYDCRLNLETLPDLERQTSMRQINPKFIFRNYLGQMCLEDVSLIEKMFEVLTHPFEEWEEFHEWSQPTPEKYQSFCVSCSS